jgi:hypothetical protein
MYINYTKRFNKRTLVSVKLRRLSKIRGYENEEVREEWKEAWKTGSSIWLFFVMIRTRPRMTRFARLSVHKAEKQIACKIVFEKVQDLQDLAL